MSRLFAEADDFTDHLFGPDARGARGPYGTPSGFDRGQRRLGVEPFLGDDAAQSWQVVGRPGTALSTLRPDDVVVRRDGSRSWRCLLGEDAQPHAIYARGRARILRDDVAVLRRAGRAAHPGEEFGELQEVCAFFGPSDVRRTEAQVRAAVVARAEAEWAAWHTAAGAPRPEGDAGMFGRLIGYYLAASGTILPDTLTALQAAALGAIDYGPLLAAGATAATITSQVARIRGLLLTGAPGAAASGLAGRVDEAIRQAREAHSGSGSFSAWSAAFVSGTVRGATIAQGLEGVIGTDRRQVGRDYLLLATLAHASYTIEARARRAARTPPRGGYHAFTPAERAPQLGDIIVQDRRGISAASQVVTLAGLGGGETHGDIVVAVQPGSVVTIGGNVGDSVRRRRFPCDASGLLVLAAGQLFTQESDTGALPALPLASALPLAPHSMARVFAVLSPVPECAAVPGQPYRGGILT